MTKSTAKWSALSVVLTTALLVGGCSQTQNQETPAPEAPANDTAAEVEEVEVSGDTYRSTLSANNFTFSIPEGAVATQADAGGESAVMVKQDGELIYSITVTSVEKSETTAFTFRDWLESQGRSLTGNTLRIGDYAFLKAREGSDKDTEAFHRYVDAAPGEQAYVITIPVLSEGDSAGEYIQNSLNFEPTEEELDAAQPVG